MDFRGRSQTERAATPAASTSSAASSAQPNFGTNQINKLKKQPVNKLFRLGGVFLLFAVTGLVITLTFLLAFGGSSQIKSVQKDKYQAVFLNNGQVYFGHIKGLNNKTLDLQNIYYLQTSGDTTAAATTQSTSSSNVSLVKLGCELHAPIDQMLINSEQIIFWENLQDSGQVVKAINDYKKQNANQACSTTSQSSTDQAPSTPTPTPTPTTKKP